jgi:hypothetical protein
MYMHATPADCMLQKVLIRKQTFVAQCRREAGLREDFA